MDFIVGLPKSKGYEVLMIVVDRLSKYSYFILLKHRFNAKGVADSFMRNVVHLHGVPRSIVSDRDPIFLNAFCTELFRLHGTKLAMGSAYHPESYEPRC